MNDYPEAIIYYAVESQYIFMRKIIFKNKVLGISNG